MQLRDALRPLTGLDALDPLADWLSGAVSNLVKGDTKSLLSGTWLGHPLHPVLTDVPIGLFGSAVLLDIVGGEQSAGAVDALTVAGILSVLPTAATGLSDWADTVGEERRVGLVHALANAGGTTLFSAAVLTRRAGGRGMARMLALGGLGALAAGAYLGGHLVYARGIGVDHNVFDEAPTEWTRVAREDQLEDDAPVLASAAGYGVLLHRRGGVIRAIADRCNHAGGPLHEGEVDDELCVTCPWHGSRFRLADGGVVRGPATAPQPAFDVRVTDGNVEVRLRPAE